MAGDPPDGPPRALMIAAVAIAVTALATVLTIAATAGWMPRCPRWRAKGTT